MRYDDWTSGGGPDRRRGVRKSLTRVVLVLAVVTALARLVGFGRSWVLSQTLGTSCLGTAFTTANALPNVVFEIAVGGALAGSIVPLLAGALARQDRDLARETVAGLYGWSLLILVPAMVVVIGFAGPLSGALLGSGGSESACPAATVHHVTASLLSVFALQLPLYGLTVVAQGALQADHRFLPTAWAPLVSSLMMIAVFLGYAQLAGAGAGSVTSLTTGQEALLAWGTTAAVAVLWLTQLPATVRAELLVVPRLRFPDGVARRARSLGIAGLVVVAGQWVVYALLFRLVNDRGVEGSAVVLLLGWTVLLLPWAVLVFPLAMGSFPRLASAHEHGDRRGFTEDSSQLLRSTVLLAGLGAAGLIATAPALAAFLVLGAPGRPSIPELTATLAAFGPAVVGFALLGAGGRVLYASHRGAAMAWVTVAGWAAAAVGAAVITAHVSATDVVAGAAAGVSIGLLLGGVGIVAVVLREFGSAGFVRAGRVIVTAFLALVAAAAVGRLVADAVPFASVGGALATAALSGAVTLATFGGVAFGLDAADTRRALRRPAGPPSAR